MTKNYKSEQQQIIICSDRRYRDKWPAPKRRDTDSRQFPRAFNAKEEELLDLIDGHIARLREERESDMRNN